MLRKILALFALVVGVVAAVGLRFDLPAAEVDARHKTAHSKFATLPDGTRMHYWDRGDKTRPSLVLLHGSFDSANTWELWAPLLEKDFHLIVPDLPAHGLTGRTKPNDYSIAAMVKAVHALLLQLQIPRAHFAGNSMGGNVSWRYALAHPERVERLVLIDSSGYPGIDSVSPQANNPITQWLLRNGNPRPLIKSGFARALGESDAELADQRADRWTDFVRREGSRDAHQKRNLQRSFGRQPFGRIAELEHPTLILWGDQDALIPVAHAKLFERDLPNDKLIIYEGVDHMPQLEIPERSAADARAFLLQ